PLGAASVALTYWSASSSLLTCRSRKIAWVRDSDATGASKADSSIPVELKPPFELYLSSTVRSAVIVTVRGGVGCAAVLVADAAVARSGLLKRATASCPVKL